MNQTKVTHITDISYLYSFQFTISLQLSRVVVFLCPAFEFSSPAFRVDQSTRLFTSFFLPSLEEDPEFSLF